MTRLSFRYPLARATLIGAATLEPRFAAGVAHWRHVSERSTGSEVPSHLVILGLPSPTSYNAAIAKRFVDIAPHQTGQRFQIFVGSGARICRLEEREAGKFARGSGSLPAAHRPP